MFKLEVSKSTCNIVFMVKSPTFESTKVKLKLEHTLPQGHVLFAHLRRKRSSIFKQEIHWKEC